jgi:hypothetical protein
MNAPKQKVTNGIGGLTIPAPREWPDPPIFWVYWLKLHMSEEAQGALNSSHINLSSLMRKLGWPWKSWVSIFLIDMEHITQSSLLLQESLPLRP